MARLFVPATSDKLLYSGAVVSGYPFTFSCWFKTTDLTNPIMLFSLCNSLSDSNHFRLTCQGNVAGDPLYFLAINGAGQNSITTTGYSSGVWHHACAVGTSATSRDVYIDGGSKGSNTNSVTPSSLNATGIGYIAKLTPSGYFDGDIALACVWNVALGANEISSLAKGLHPKKVRPLSIAGGWNMEGIFSPEPDFSGTAKHMVVTGTTRSNNPPVIPYRKAWWGSIPLIEAAAGGLSVPVAAYHYNHHLGSMT